MTNHLKQRIIKFLENNNRLLSPNNMTVVVKSEFKKKLRDESNILLNELKKYHV